MKKSRPSEQDFFAFIYKRQLIWYRRFVLKKTFPWTDDEILRTYKFINMYRELDKCTQYIVEKLKCIQDRRTLLLNIIFYRFFNLSGLYELLKISPFKHLTPALVQKLDERFRKLRKEGTAIFNNAYVISPGASRKAKHRSILENLSVRDKHLSQMINDLDAAKTPQESFDVLLQVPLLGPFLSCEIWTDLTYFHFFKQSWDDNDFVNIGPGAKWGLEIMYGKMPKKKYGEKLYHLYSQQKKFLPQIHKKMGEKLSWKKIAYKNAASNFPFLSITNIEGALCEFRKYCNLSQGKGRRRYYKG